VSIVGKENASGNIFNRISYGQDAFGLDLDKSMIPIAAVRPTSIRFLFTFMAEVLPLRVRRDLNVQAA